MIKNLILLIGLLSFTCAGNLITLLPYESAEFSPALNQEFKIPFTIKEEATVRINIYTPDNNLIRSLEHKSLVKGNNNIVWDGKDSEGIYVPDEAYTIVVIATNKLNKEVIDNRFTGGVILKELHTRVDKIGNINYKLSVPARVLVRAGIRNGPMLRSISNWLPKNKGITHQRWNMKDKEKLIDISKLDFSVSVSAFSLPDFSILTRNNKQISYIDYFLKKQFKCVNMAKHYKNIKTKQIKLSKHIMRCRIEDINPNIIMNILSIQKSDENITILKNGERVKIKLTMKHSDEITFEKAKYEVSFFIDNEFKSEEESGYMPFVWNYTPNGLLKGEHILTVNVSSFSGQIGLQNYKFKIK